MNPWLIGIARTGTALALVASVLVPATAASAADNPEDDGPWYLFNRKSTLCLDVPNQTSGGNGTRLQVWACITPDQVNQQWERNWITKTTFELRSSDSDRCLEARSSGRVVIFDCDSSRRVAQQWRVRNNRLKNVKFDKVLDAPGTTNGSPVTVNSVDTQTDSQRWTFRSPDDFD
ncbi:ricin-type beta-trefoil lectin domain protein [Actinoplanes sp. NPDC051851]|uniref:ricin-type beta-trefoil lectin domain protein n=1 Tax=Actinoplanes sp. NPDC051851 TaxID=3154753 RepID=UPI00341DC918